LVHLWRCCVQNGVSGAVNSTFEWNDHVHLFDRVGKGAFFSDCTFMRQGYALGESATLSDGGLAAGLVFQHNLVTIFNSFVGITPGLTSTLVRFRGGESGSNLGGNMK